MDIGEPFRTIVVEPIESPVPASDSSPFAPDAIGPIVGWRLWRILRARDGLVLGSAAKDAVWPTGRAFSARCELGGTRHESPAPRCRCGVHALRHPEALFDCPGGRFAPPLPYAVGIVG